MLARRNGRGSTQDVFANLLAFHSAVFEKADAEKSPLDTGSYTIAEDLRYY